MTISQQVLAPFAILSNDGTSVIADVNSFVLRLLLFDTYIVESSMLRDIAQLVEVFGADGLIDLIKSGAIKIHIDTLTTGQVEKTIGESKFPAEMPSSSVALPLLHYSPIVAHMPDRDKYVDRSLRNLRLSSLGKKTISRLQNSVVDKLTEPPGHNPNTFQWARASLLSNNDVTVTALEQVLKEKYSVGLAPTAFQFSFRASGESGYAVSTNIGKIFHLTAYEEHKVFESVVLKMLGFYQRISQMNSYDAIAWFSDSDASILNSEIKLTINEYDSSRQEQRFTRILSLKGLPTILPKSRISANSLIRLRESKECKAFRVWLSTSDAKSDDDIKRELNSFRAAFSAFFHSTTVKAVRFIVPNVVGLNPVASVAVQTVDKIVAEKLLPTNGPIAFINNKLPPVLRNDPYSN